MFMLYFRAIRAGRCRERRYADHIFIQMYFRMHHFVVKFSKFSSPQAARGHWLPNQNLAEALALFIHSSFLPPIFFFSSTLLLSFTSLSSLHFPDPPPAFPRLLLPSFPHFFLFFHSSNLFRVSLRSPFFTAVLSFSFFLSFPLSILRSSTGTENRS